MKSEIPAQKEGSTVSINGKWMGIATLAVATYLAFAFQNTDKNQHAIDNSSSETLRSSKLDFDHLDMATKKEFAHLTKGLIDHLGESKEITIDSNVYSIKKMIDRITVSRVDNAGEYQETTFVVPEPRFDNEGNNLDENDAGVVNYHNPLTQNQRNGVKDAMQIIGK